MLTVYVRRLGETMRDVVPAGALVIEDVEAAFFQTDFTVTKEANALVKSIEDGELIDRYSFLDRFGYKLPVSALSTGAKAALLVACTNSIVDLRECGWNARDSIISFCGNGAVVIDDPDVDICDESGGATVAISCDGKIFNTVDAFSEYLSYEQALGV